VKTLKVIFSTKLQWGELKHIFEEKFSLTESGCLIDYLSVEEGLYNVLFCVTSKDIRDTTEEEAWEILKTIEEIKILELKIYTKSFIDRHNTKSRITDWDVMVEKIRKFYPEYIDIREKDEVFWIGIRNLTENLYELSLSDVYWAILDFGSALDLVPRDILKYSFDKKKEMKSDAPKFC